MTNSTESRHEDSDRQDSDSKPRARRKKLFDTLDNKLAICISNISG